MKNLTTINVVIPWGERKGQTVPFEGEKFQYQGIDLVIGKIGFVNANKKTWRVYEPSSGKAMTGNYDTKKECLKCVEDRFTQFGVEKIKELIQQAISENQKSNL
jgi:hypothetical protein